MSTVSLRRKSIRPGDFDVAYTAPGELVVHLRELSVELTESEFYMAIGTILAKKRAAEDHQAVRDSMLPKGRAK